jgi:hypothetical protein
VISSGLFLLKIIRTEVNQAGKAQAALIHEVMAQQG